jgi:Glycosyl hydrolase family 12/Putative peptidoglycan binding domain
MFRRIIPLVTVFIVVLGGGVALLAGVNSDSVANAANAAGPITLDGGFYTAPVTGGYTLQANEFNSKAPLVITSDGNADMDIQTSGVSTPLGGAPGAFPGFYYGNHWGVHSDQTTLPLALSKITGGGIVRSSVSVNYGSAPSDSVYDTSWDIFFTPSADQAQNQGTDLEMMVWLHNVGVPHPAGTQVGTVTIGGDDFNVWWSHGSSHSILSYQFASPETSANIDVGLLAADAIKRGYLDPSWFLIDVEYGYEIWTNCTGVKVTSFSVNGNGASPVPTPTPIPVPTHAPTKSVGLPLLKYGDTGLAVKVLQVLLNNRDNAGLKVSGRFGNGTLAAVESFQSEHGIPVSGQVGKVTWFILTSVP